MPTLLAFVPFIAFALVDRLVGPLAGLVAGAAASGLLLLREAFVLRRSPKFLEVGTLLLFGGLAAYAAFVAPDWSILGVRLRVELGLLLAILFSLAIGRPFTLQYAREPIAAYLLVTGAAVARLLLPLVAPRHTAAWLSVAAFAWAAAFALYLWVFAPWLMSRRLDDKDG